MGALVVHLDSLHHSRPDSHPYPAVEQGHVCQVKFVLSLGSSLDLSPTFVLARTSSRLIFRLWLFIALIISPFVTSQNLTSLSPISPARSLHSLENAKHFFPRFKTDGRTEGRRERWRERWKEVCTMNKMD